MFVFHGNTANSKAIERLQNAQEKLEIYTSYIINSEERLNIFLDRVAHKIFASTHHCQDFASS
jgi:hypothetical protein